VNKKDKKVITFAKLLHEIQEEDKVISNYHIFSIILIIEKSNTNSLKQMELRKSKRIYLAGTTDDFILSKKNKNLNNMKLFEKVSTASVKHNGPSMQDKQSFGPN
jgi:hypothetical protein